MYKLSDEDVAISGPVYRSINDVVNKMTGGNVSGWEDNYKIFLDSDGQIKAVPVGPNKQGLFGFRSGLEKKLAFLPTPVWVKDSKRRVYFCFTHELPGLMKEWWREYSELLG